jgi:hypothetical protein
MNKQRAEYAFNIIVGWFAEQGEIVPHSEWGLFDHHHEELSEGAWSLACEGYLDPEWAITAAASEELRNRLGTHVFIEPILGCILGIYDA